MLTGKEKRWWKGGWFRPIWSLVAALSLLAMVIAPALADDTIILTNGKMYTGTILSETDEFVEFDTKISNIPTRMKIEREDIRSIVRDHRGWNGTNDKPDETPGQIEENGSGVRVMEIPLVGTFGQDILPIGFQGSLDYARRNKIKHIVLRIDSPGGQVWAARSILQMIEANRSQFEFQALIEHSISAAIWPTFACDTIHMAPRGEFGGAVAFRQSSLGNVEVDAKMNSILAAEIVTIAESLGHDGDVVRAMMLMESELYAQTSGRRVILKGFRDAGSSEQGEQIDGPTTVLTLTTKEAVRLGVAKPLRSASLDALFQALGFEEWNEIKGGAGVMERWTGQCEKRRKLAESSAIRLLDYYQQAEETEDIDEAIDALVGFQREHPRFAKYYSELMECFPTDESIDAEDVQEMTRKVRALIKELRRIKREGP